MTIAPPSRPPPLSASNGTTHKPKNRLAIIDPATVPPDRSIVNAVEGWGKTSLVAYAPKPAILMARGETGYPTLLKAGLVPSLPAVELVTWADTLDQLDYMIANPDGIETLALDALGGFERLCHEHVCNRDFGGEWGDKGFQAYMRGYDVSISEWLLMLQRLDRLRNKGVQIIILSHAKSKTFKNPLGADFDRYSADCHDKTWAATTKWADNIFFGTFTTVVVDGKGAIATSDAVKGRKKGIGGDERIVYTQRRDGYDAKNRHGMEPEISMPNIASEMWLTLMGGMSHAPVADDIPPV